MNELHLQLDRLLEMSRLEQARKLLERAFAEHPGDPENHYYAARIAELAGDLAEATRQIGELFRSRPKHGAGLSLAVDIARKRKDYPLAEQHALELIHDNPEEGHYYAQYAHVMLETLHLEKARKLTLEARRLSPENQLAGVLDVLTSVVMGEPKRAREDLAELVEHSPDALSVAWTLMAVLEAEHRHEEALAVAQEIVRATPHDRDAIHAAIEFRARTHWFALPAWPLQRFGYAASIGLWGLAVVGLSMAAKSRSVSLGVLLLTLWLGYVIYSWTYLPLLRRWLRARGL